MTGWRADVWTLAGRRAWVIGDALSQSATWRTSTRTGTATLTVPMDHEAGRLLRDTPGLLVAMEYRGLRWCGQVTTMTTASSESESDRTFYLVGPWAMLGDQLCYPVPGQPATNQVAAEKDTRTGPVESVVKGYVSPIVARLGLPVRVLPDAGRGPTVSLSARFDTLTELVGDTLDTAGMQVTVGWWLPGDPQPGGATLTTPTVLLDVVPAPVTPGMVWSRFTGLVSAQTTTTSPEVTRVVVAGPGEGTARINRVVYDDVAEARIGVTGVRESYVDARGVDGSSVSTQMDARGREALTEGAGSRTVRLELAEDAWQLSGTPGPGKFQPGSRVHVLADDDLDIDDVITAVTVAVGADRPEPTVTSLEVGEVVTTLAKAAARTTDALTASVRALQKGR